MITPKIEAVLNYRGGFVCMVLSKLKPSPKTKYLLQVANQNIIEISKIFNVFKLN